MSSYLKLFTYIRIGVVLLVEYLVKVEGLQSTEKHEDRDPLVTRRRSFILKRKILKYFYLYEQTK